ncbi:MAG: hypothetical protein L0196_11570 [candidate division Zixibacteria bacterium]|nr:hypothetical protein [candidate division Zixibacteria bacterium]
MKRLMVLVTTGVLLGLVLSTVAAADTKPVQEAEEATQAQPNTPAESATDKPAPVPVPVESTPNPASVRSVSPQAFQLNWLSINGGGAINATSDNYRLGLSVGQSVSGYATSSSYQMGMGFWYGATGAPACAAAKGDLNGSGGFSGADIVLLIQCTFNQNGTGTVGGDCNLCYSDVNCTGNLSGADIVLLIAATFNGAPFPC